MCVPCCNSNAEYINKEGKLEQWFLDKHYPKGSKGVKIQDSESPLAKIVWQREGYFPERLKVVDPLGNIIDLCDCACHQVGSMLMH